MTEILYGLHAVQAALTNRRRRLDALWIRPAEARRPAQAELRKLAASQGLKVRQRAGGVFDTLDKRGSRHQGCALEAGPLPLADLDDVCDLAARHGQHPLLLAADHIQDPRNLGAMIRSAEVCGVHGLIVPRDRACPLTPTVSQTSAGALEHMPVTRAASLSRDLERLRERGLWIYGLEAQGPDTVAAEDADLDRPLVLAVGSEDRGLSPAVRRACDLLLFLRMRGRTESFNASAAASIAFYLAQQARSDR